VSDHEFLFALELSNERTFEELVTELAHLVLRHVGLSRAAIDELTRALRVALADGAATGRRRCDIRFIAHAGELQIAVACDGAATWHTTRPLA
jgi:hypothetical protein